MASKAGTMQRVDQSIFAKRINIRQMGKMIEVGAKVGKTTFFYGGAGLGKSQKVEQVANEMFPHHIGNNLCDVRLSDKEPTDLTGAQIPIVINEDTGEARTVYATANFWPTDPDWEGIVFLDELPNAIAATQQAAYQVILDHCVGTFKFPKGAVFVGAGNRDTDNGATTELLGPLVNRMILCEVEYDLTVWVEDFAVPKDINGKVIGFLKQFPEYFYTGDVETRKSPVFASPRQWETVSRLCDLWEQGFFEDDPYLFEIALQGAVGEGLDSAFVGYFERASKLPDIEDIFAGNVTKHPLRRDEVDLLYVLSMSCMRKLRKEIESQMSDEEVLKRCGNFLTFMYDNYAKENHDVVTAMFIEVFRTSGTESSILTSNPKREKMIPRLCKISPIVGKVVTEYHSKYAALLADM